MGERLDSIRRFVAELEQAGLTPFDLCSWATLLVLTERVGDLDWCHQVNEALEDAIERKATDLDEAHGGDFHRTIRGERRL